MKHFCIDFMKYRKATLLFSLICVLASLGLLLFRGLNLGIDFTGGNVVQVEFSTAISVGEVRDILASVGQEGAVIQAYSDVGVIIRTGIGDDQTRVAVVDALREKHPDLHVVGIEKVGPVVGAELRKEAMIALGLSLAGILVYISVRFQFRFAVVSVLVLMHDAIITLGVFSLTGMEVSSSFIAAILTIVGYSINNSIVVLDRVRENWNTLKSDGIITLLNNSINETLSRTINTSLTTLLPLIALFLWGGNVLRIFSFALLIGLTAGTYSSIYMVAGMLAGWWEKSPQRV